MMFDLIIKNGVCVIPKVGVKEADLAIHDGRIAAILERGAVDAEAAQEIDAAGKYIFPGVIDPHVHYGFYNKLEDDFYQQTNAAAIGGITSVVMYYRGGESYHKYAPWLISTGEKSSALDFAFSFGIMTNQHLSEVEDIISRYGVTSFKHYRNYQGKLQGMFNTEDALRYDSADLLDIMRKLTAISPKLLLCCHCENPDMIDNFERKYGDVKDNNTLKFHSAMRPDYAETDSALQTMYINHVANGKLYIVHLSAGSSVEMMEKTPWLMENVTVETTPHYLTLNENSPCGILAKVLPAVHTEKDSEKLWEGIRKGIVTTIGSDTNPSTLAVKFSRGTNAWDTLPAFPNAGVILPILLSEGYHKRGIPLQTVAEISSYNIAKAFHLTGKGDIAVGCDADLNIVDLELSRVVKPDIFGDSDYSVYDGMEWKGWPVMTISRGEVIVKDGKSSAHPGRGRYIKRTI